MHHVVYATIFATCLFGGMLALLEFGLRRGRRRLTIDPEGARAGLGTVDGSVFALLGLLLAFTFSGAAARFDERRKLIVEEVNAIGTAWLRTDLLPAEAQAPLRESFRHYVDARLEVYRRLPDLPAVQEALARATALQGEIWSRAVAASREGVPPAASMLLLPALNAMFDITTTRTAAVQMHPPFLVYGMLATVAFVSSMLAGYGMAGGRARSWMHMISFAAITAIAVYVILDFEFPRFGLLRVDGFDEMLVNLRQSMNP